MQVHIQYFFGQRKRASQGGACFCYTRGKGCIYRLYHWEIERHTSSFYLFTTIVRKSVAKVSFFMVFRRATPDCGLIFKK